MQLAHELPWLPDCVNKFTATAENVVLDLLPFFKEDMTKKEFIDFENSKEIKKEQRAIHFDLAIAKIDKLYKYRSEPYTQIKKILTKLGFERQQGSGYISKEALSSEQFIDKIYQFSEEFPNFKELVKHVDATYLKTVYDVTPFLKDTKISFLSEADDKNKEAEPQKQSRNSSLQKQQKEKASSKKDFFM